MIKKLLLLVSISLFFTINANSFNLYSGTSLYSGLYIFYKAPTIIPEPLKYSELLFMDSSHLTIAIDDEDYIYDKWVTENYSTLMSVDDGYADFVTNGTYYGTYTTTQMKYKQAFRNEYINTANWSVVDNSTSTTLSIMELSYYPNSESWIFLRGLKTNTKYFFHQGWEPLKINHYIYLVTSPNMISGHTYTINNITDNMQVVVNYNYKETLSQTIHVNQDAYNVSANAEAKIVYFGRFLPAITNTINYEIYPTFGIQNVDTNEVVYTGDIVLRQADRRVSSFEFSPLEFGYDVYCGTFNITDIGTYNVFVEGVGKSWDFQVNTWNIGDVYWKGSHAMYYARHGDKSEEYSPWGDYTSGITMHRGNTPPRSSYIAETLLVTMDATTDVLVYNDDTYYTIGQKIGIGSKEIVQIAALNATSSSRTTVNVIRGVDGTTPTAHVVGVNVIQQLDYGIFSSYGVSAPFNNEGDWWDLTGVLLTNTNLPTEQVSCLGDWFDASDYDSTMTAHLWQTHFYATAYLLNPTANTDGQLRIPENNNGIPDILDKAWWGIKPWYEYQQYIGTGGVANWLNSPSGYPSSGPYYFDRPSRRASMFYSMYAAVLAKAFFAFDANSVSGNILLESSIDAYEYAITTINANDFSWKMTAGADSKVNDKYWLSDVTYNYVEPQLVPHWALHQASYIINELTPNATWEERVSNNSIYKMPFFRCYGTMADWGVNPMFIGHVFYNPDYMPDYVSTQRTKLETFINEVFIDMDKDTFFIPEEYDFNHDYWYTQSWGSAYRHGANFGIGIWKAINPTNNIIQQKCIDYFQHRLNYLSGANVMGRSWMTGHGYNYPSFYNHHISQELYKEGVYDPVMGMIPYGPQRAIESSAFQRAYGYYFEQDETTYTISLIPEQWFTTENMSYTEHQNTLKANMPVRNRWNPLGNLGNLSNEFTIQETHGMWEIECALMMDSGWTAGSHLLNRQPETVLRNLHGKWNIP